MQTLSLIDIANMALGNLRCPAIAATTEPSLEAAAVRTYLTSALDAALRAHPWNWATRTITLPQAVDPPADPWGYAYGLPSDCLYVQKIMPKEDESITTKFEVALTADGGEMRLMTNAAPPCWCRYTMRVTNPALFDPLFVRAFAWRLASDMSIQLTADSSLTKLCETQYQNAILTAKATDAQEGVNEPLYTPPWIEARGIDAESIVGVRML